MNLCLFTTEAFTVFSGASADTLTPEVKTLALESGAHELNDSCFGEISPLVNRFKTGAITPSHVNDAIDLFLTK
jgi:hypothetical protein